jgi:hypothetical protein
MARERQFSPLFVTEEENEPPIFPGLPSPPLSPLRFPQFGVDVLTPGDIGVFPEFMLPPAVLPVFSALPQPPPIVDFPADEEPVGLVTQERISAEIAQINSVSSTSPADPLSGETKDARTDAETSGFITFQVFDQPDERPGHSAADMMRYIFGKLHPQLVQHPGTIPTLPTVARLTKEAISRYGFNPANERQEGGGLLIPADVPEALNQAARTTRTKSSSSSSSSRPPPPPPSTSTTGRKRGRSRTVPVETLQEQQASSLRQLQALEAQQQAQLVAQAVNRQRAGFSSDTSSSSSFSSSVL